jgi:hypothetical protein
MRTMLAAGMMVFAATAGNAAATGKTGRAAPTRR